jgi:hypothetical protein
MLYCTGAKAMPQPANLQSEQSIQIQANGPDGATTMFITTGLMFCNFSQNNQTGDGFGLNETFSALLTTPRLAPGQFRRAIATASLAGIDGAITIVALGSSPGFGTFIQSVDADFDDETGAVRLLVDLHVGAAFGSAEIVAVGFQVMTTAAM